MTIKMIALDLDGTLLRDDKTIDPTTIAALKRAREQGVIVTLASGRDKNGSCEADAIRPNSACPE